MENSCWLEKFTVLLIVKIIDYSTFSVMCTWREGRKRIAECSLLYQQNKLSSILLYKENVASIIPYLLNT